MTTKETIMTTLTKNRKIKFGPRAIVGWGDGAMLTATVRYDDKHGNGHNTFSITGQIETPRSRRAKDYEACGMLHEEISNIFPELTPYIKWHLTSSDGPMHYIANTIYWAQIGKLEYARQAAVWPNATSEQLKDKHALIQRLPQLLAEFKADIERLGLTY